MTFTKHRSPSGEGKKKPAPMHVLAAKGGGFAWHEDFPDVSFWKEGRYCMLSVNIDERRRHCLTGKQDAACPLIQHNCLPEFMLQLNIYCFILCFLCPVPDRIQNLWVFNRKDQLASAVSSLSGAVPLEPSLQIPMQRMMMDLPARSLLSKY